MNHTLPSLEAIELANILLLICHVTSCDYVNRGSCDIMGEFPLL